MSQVASSYRSPCIAIIGLEGSGKTVLATTLAKRLSTIDSRGMFLNPQGVKTLKYVEGIWHTLQSGDWPSSTPPGELFELKWKFQIVGELECDVRLIDAAGQDLRLLFGDDDEPIYSVDSIPSHLQSLAGYCRSADIVLFLVNLKDYEGQGNAARRADNQAAIKAAMDYFGSDGRQRRVCLLLTQMDLYRELARAAGGWLELAARAIPYVFGAHVQMNQTAVYPVAAVADTNVIVDEDGTPRRVPVAGFRSEGLDDVVGWLTTQVREVKAELEHDAEISRLKRTGTTLPTQPSGPPAPRESPWSTIAGWIVAIVIGLLILRGCTSGCGDGRPPPPPPKPPIYHEQDGSHKEQGGDSAWTAVVNPADVPRTVVVTAIISDGNQQWSQSKTVTIPAYGRQPVEFWIPGASTGPNATFFIEAK